MKSKIRRISDWKTYKNSVKRHDIGILATHIAVIIGAFIFVAFL
ncbi:hypothetical protein [Chryseobacterium salviniae]|uniref:Uncharacterized protein n=1 Tax=Chryseobacterium salviniae TaxID=3101750 RepID=A0ABU6HP91_9FLAO|nr:hypothetical protein [Chryseobacterium sp. T9W2-O]MEC3874839.1 hypothetical protein [Chryseobacterium sp. T9W2-O]